MSSRTTWLVIPCFNEVARLAGQNIAELVANDDVGVVLVDDGSDDGTRELMFNIHTLKDLARIVYPISTSIVNYRIRNKNGPATSHTLSRRCDIFSR